jgi:hypothetical protein
MRRNVAEGRSNAHTLATGADDHEKVGYGHLPATEMMCRATPRRNRHTRVRAGRWDCRAHAFTPSAVSAAALADPESLEGAASQVPTG